MRPYVSASAKQLWKINQLLHSCDYISVNQGEKVTLPIVTMPVSRSDASTIIDSLMEIEDALLETSDPAVHVIKLSKG
tara:strand:- start:51 stop:284 length:234 start_codon:yes stop_codon:yes gene_type:complete